jgi:hypothetical protein
MKARTQFIRKKVWTRMQAWSGQNDSGTRLPAHKLTTTIVLVFSLAGLISGFAFGGLIRSKPNTTNSGLPPKSTPVAQNTNTITPTATTQPIVALNPPATVNLSAATQVADGATTYSITIQAVDKQNKAVHATNITCKLWVVKQIPANQILNLDSKTLKSVNTLQGPITGTVHNQPAPDLSVNNLTFDPTTPQLGFCKANGQMTWKYKIASTMPAGNYDLVILTDWNGVHFNWSWDNITITAS